MARKKANPVEGLELQNGQGEQVMVWKATIPLSVEEHAQLAAKLQMEHERSGVKILLVPYSVDAEVVAEQKPAGGVGGNPETGDTGEPGKKPEGGSGE